MFIRTNGFVLKLFHRLHFSSEPHLTPGGSGFLQILLGLMRNSERLAFPFFAALGKGKLALRTAGCLCVLKFCFTGEMLADVVWRKGATSGSLDGWEWRS